MQSGIAWQSWLCATFPISLKVSCTQLGTCERKSNAVIGFGQSSAKFRYKLASRFRRSVVEETDHQHCWVLRPRHIRPRGSDAAEERDELAPLQSIEMHSLPLPRSTE